MIKGEWMVYTVQQILQKKGSAVYSVEADASIYEALQVMAEKDVGALLVFEQDKIVGIFSERDYARKVALRGKSSRQTLVSEVMSRHVVYVRPHQSTEECMALMTAKHFRHLPVLEDDQVVGVISIGDVVKALISKQEFVIEQLENYISGER
jgi:CBS domain-containing protein